ncbi:DUF2163 domain-containing protein [Amylibacter sp. SFDW26]|uniref:DUF2163 domain-containing protein n=1 Tax=Amylibacter sp. SFDW26 TaxID=2652722 RepID=UPI001261B352|nr:DUF2163 domain-containing protein [Amylibacter sp. SFDW26]KAB7616073.1 DUF2163 domain-containing protein [Amylibacter sp. SFDW26]
MNGIPEALKAHVKSGVTSLCRCWILVRSDGERMGFTDHDCGLSFEETEFIPTTGMDAAALERSTGLAVDNSQAVGALSSVGLTDDDIEQGLYDGASITQYLVNWEDVEQRMITFKGTIGEIKRGSGAFEAELRSISEGLNQPIGRAYLRQCGAQVGDARCQVDLTGAEFTSEAEVTFSVGQRVLHLKGLDSYDDTWFLQGTVAFVTGENTGAVGVVKVDQINGPRRVLEMWEDLRHPIGVGDRVQVTAGCDKAENTCRVKFSNLLNFRGFPKMPGDDWALSYPVRDGQNDGSSLR